MNSFVASIIILAILISVIVLFVFLGKLVSTTSDYVGPGGKTFVRCKDGHLFITIWVPFVSFKAIRLGSVRFQYCPVGRHWTLVRPVKESDLSEREKEEASKYQDSDIL